MSDKEHSDEEIKTEVPPAPKVKKENSYTYWVNNDPNFFKNAPKPDIKPKPVEASSLPQPVDPSSINGKGEHSAWNTAGTWEEKHLGTDKIKKVLESKLINYSLGGGKAKIIEVSKCEGDAKLIVSRGKKRLGYTLAITYKVEGAAGKSHSTITLKEFLDDGDYEIEVGTEEDDDDTLKSTVQSAGKAVAQATYDAINTLKEM